MRPPMGSEPRYWFALAAEDADHHKAVTRLTDRVLAETIEGFSHATPEATRRWRERNALAPYWKVTGAEKEARSLGLPLRGHFAGKGELEAVTYRAQLLVWKHAHVHGQPIHVGVIARDTDKTARKEGARRAMESAPWPFLVVLAFPDPEVEAWPIAVFCPVTKADRKRIEDLTKRLGFSPVDHPHRLTSTVQGERDAKAVHAALFEGDAAREDDWLEADLAMLRERGKTCGLADFLGDLDAAVRSLLA